MMDDRQVLQEAARRLVFIEAMAFRNGASSVQGNITELKKLITTQLATPPSK